MSIINIENFFDFGSKKPVNRIAYSIEDAKYKLKIMRYMQDLGMHISIDDVGNICGTLKGNAFQKKNLVLGSHTDSVTNGGQFDGPVGVYMALKAIEDYKSSGQKQFGNLKAVIYACEESTRFSKACLGSYYLSKELSYEDIEELYDKQGIPFSQAIAEYKDYIFSHLAEYGIDLNNISLVDRILSEEEISEAIESHIEQSESLLDAKQSIGAIDSIGKPIRGSIHIDGENSVITSAKVICRLNDMSLNSKHNNQEFLRISVPKFDSKPEGDNSQMVISDNSDLLQITAIGESNHSGSTPMTERKDAVLGLSKLILKLDELQKQNPNVQFEFLGTATNVWGANQIQDNADLVVRINSSTYTPLVIGLVQSMEEQGNIAFNTLEIPCAEIQKVPSADLFVDIRQQYPAKASQTRDLVFDRFKKIQEEYGSGTDSIFFKISSMDDPILTSPELLENIKLICDEKKYPCQIMHSWPGHDLACILPPNNTSGKKVLFFIPSKGGSHNPNEETTREAIEIGTDVYSTLVSQRMSKFQKAFEEYEKDAR